MYVCVKTYKIYSFQWKIEYIDEHKSRICSGISVIKIRRLRWLVEKCCENIYCFASILMYLGTKKKKRKRLFIILTFSFILN